VFRNDSRSECFPLLILKKDDFVCSLSNGSCKLFELYGNETKMKLLAKELAPLQNIGSQNCITFSVDRSKFATGGSDGHIRIMEWPSMNNILDEPRAHKSVQDMDFSSGGEKGIQEAAILDVLALGYVAVGHLKTVASLLNVRKLEDTFQENSNWLKLLASYEDSPAGVFDEAQPVNVPTSFKQRAMLVDEIWHAAGDNASDIDWYTKRTVLQVTMLLILI
ncbi:hypothetical protein S245_040796, partial [Arachis hypogaea]